MARQGPLVLARGHTESPARAVQSLAVDRIRWARTAGSLGAGRHSHWEERAGGLRLAVQRAGIRAAGLDPVLVLVRVQATGREVGRAGSCPAAGNRGVLRGGERGVSFTQRCQGIH